MLRNVCFAGALLTISNIGMAAYPETDFAGRPSYIPNNVVVLTFDDGPDWDNTDDVLNILKSKNVKATFFINSDNWSNIDTDEPMRALVRRMNSEGHLIGNHTAHHLHLSALSDNNVHAEIIGVQNSVNSIFNNTSHRLTMLRAPYGDPYQGSDPANPNDMYRRVAPIVAKYAVHVGWNIDSEDWLCGEWNGDCVYNNLTGLLKSPGQGDYGIILMHSVNSSTPLALGRIIDYIRSKGFQIWSTEDVIRRRYGKTSAELIGNGSVNPPPPPGSGAIYKLVSQYSGKCLDVNNGDIANGTNILQWSCHTGDNQKFRLQAGANNTFSLVNVGSGKCVDVSGPSTADGANIHQWDCHGGTNQQIKIIDSASGSKIIRFMHSGKCMDIAGPSTVDGMNVHQWSCHGGSSQNWFLRP